MCGERTRDGHEPVSKIQTSFEHTCGKMIRDRCEGIDFGAYVATPLTLVLMLPLR
jgi:hypothetical protein